MQFEVAINPDTVTGQTNNTRLLELASETVEERLSRATERLERSSKKADPDESKLRWTLRERLKSAKTLRGRALSIISLLLDDEWCSQQDASSISI